MKKLLLTTALAMLTALCAVGKNYDFIAKSETNNLYYKITDDVNKEVELVSETDSWGWAPYTTEPSGTLIIPSTVTYNGTIYSVTSIGSRAFKYCAKLTGDLTIPNSITSIGEDAFNNCEGFKGDLIIPNSVTTIGGGAFYNCNFNGSLTIGNSVTTIGEEAFKYCNGLTGDLTIPNSVTSIGDNAFNDCRGLTGDLTIPNSVTTIGEGAFYGCEGFNGSLTIPNSVTTIAKNAFKYCTELTGSLTIPNSVTSIGEAAFHYCSSFDGILTIGNGVTTIGKSAFYECGFKGSLIIPDNVKRIEDSAFRSCGFTGSLTIGKGVSSIGREAFRSCLGLSGILTIPNTIMSLERDVFAYCSGFVGNLTIPESVFSIAENAFFRCSGFTGLTIPSSVTSIEDGAFGYCSGFEKVINCASYPQKIDKTVFSYVEVSEIPLYVPETSVEDYGYADYWKDFGTINGIYTITVELEGGELITSIPTIYTEESKTIMLPTNVSKASVIEGGKRIDYTFAGWSNGTEIITNIPKGSVGNVTLTATYKEDVTLAEYTITAELEGGELLTLIPAIYTVESETIILPIDVSKASVIEVGRRIDYTFAGWSNGTKIITNIPKGSVGDVTLTATYMEGITNFEYSITVELDGGELSTSIPTTYTIEDAITLPTDVSKANSDVVDGQCVVYTFMGWNNGSEIITKIAKGSIGNITLTAIYTEKLTNAKYNITVELEGGELSTPIPTSYILGSETIELPVPTKANGQIVGGQYVAFKFTGWSNGKSIITEIVKGTSGDISLTATWKEEVEICYQLEGGYNLSYKINEDGKTVTCLGLFDKNQVVPADLVIPTVISNRNTEYVVTKIADKAFYDCSVLTKKVILPPTINEIGEAAFAESPIIGVTLPKYLQVIPKDCFKGTALENVELPNSLSIIEEGAFASTNLSGVVELPHTLTLIKAEAFKDVDGYATIILPEYIVYIGSNAFANFNGEKIVALSEMPLDLSGQLDVFEGVDASVVKLAVPDGSVEAYSNADIWDRFKNNISVVKYINVANPVELTYNAGTIKVDVFSNADWKTTSNTDWFTAVKVGEKLLIVVDENKSIQREGKIILSATDVEPIEITVIQKDVIFVESNIEDITLDVNKAFVPIDLSEHFTYGDYSELQFVAQSGNEEVASVIINGKMLGIIPNAKGKTDILLKAFTKWGTENEISFSVTVTDINGSETEPLDCDGFVIDETIINVGCPGDETGSIELEVSGNTAPYKYRWSNTQTESNIYNLLAGEYTVIIRDALGCVETRTYEVEGSDDISIEPKFINPECGKNNGSVEVNVKGGTAPYSYEWSNGEKGAIISNLYSGVYALMVKDSRKCEYETAIVLDSKVSIKITIDSAKNAKCSAANKGEIHVSVSGGTPPYNLAWADGGIGFSRTNLDEGVYNLVVTDDKGCTANLSHEIQSTSFLTPAIGLVSVDRTTDNNLIIWHKEKTSEIDFYNIYRENPKTKEFEVVGTWDYENIGVFEDLEANTFERSWRYRLQAENDCGDRSKLSKSFKTIHMKSVELTEEGVALTWDDYEGEVYPTYAIHRVFGSEAVLEARVPFHTSYYFDANPPKEVTSYFVAVELPEEFVVEGNRLKAESGPFILAVSNIAEVEINAGGGNDDETSLNSVLNQISVYPTVAKDVITVTVGAGQQAQVMLYTLTGEKVYEQEVLETAELNVSNMPKGVYTVVVTINGVGYGYKVIVND